MRLNSIRLIKFCGTLTVLSPRTVSVGLWADPAFGEGRRSGDLFFARHLDCFIVTRNSQPLPGLGTVKTNYRDPKLFSHLPGLAKNAVPRPFANALGRLRRHLIKLPGPLCGIARKSRDCLHYRIYHDTIFSSTYLDSAI
jgi:hypothetical protein